MENPAKPQLKQTKRLGNTKRCGRFRFARPGKWIAISDENSFWTAELHTQQDNVCPPNHCVSTAIANGTMVETSRKSCASRNRSARLSDQNPCRALRAGALIGWALGDRDCLVWGVERLLTRHLLSAKKIVNHSAGKTRDAVCANSTAHSRHRTLAPALRDRDARSLTASRQNGHDSRRRTGLSGETRTRMPNRQLKWSQDPIGEGSIGSRKDVYDADRRQDPCPMYR